MSIVMVGDNYEDWTGSFTRSTTAVHYDSDFAKETLAANHRVSGVGQPPTKFGQSPRLASTVSEWWFHCDWYPEGSFLADNEVISFLNNGTMKFAFKTAAGTSGGGYNTFALGYFSGGSWTDVGSTFTLTLGQLYTVDIFMSPGTPTSDVRVYIDGTLRASFTGAFTTGGGDTVDQVRLSGTANNDPGERMMYSQCIWTDAEADDTRTWKLATLMPDTDGEVDGNWTPSSGTDASALIDETGATGQTDYISTDSDGDIQTWQIEDFAGTVATDYEIVQVSLFMDVEKIAGASVDDVDFVIRENSSDTNDFSNNSGSLTDDTLTKLQADFATNPHTSSAWSTSDLDDEDFDFGVRANT